MRRRRDRGLTLLETLVALALTAVVLAALAGMVGRTTRAHARATGATARHAILRDVLLRLAAELESADPHQPCRVTRDGTLRFGTFGRADGDPRVVVYRVDPVAATLLRYHAPARSNPEDRPPVTVLRDVRAIRLRCLDADGWRDDWHADTLPRAIEVILQTRDDDVRLRIKPAAAG